MKTLQNVLLTAAKKDKGIYVIDGKQDHFIPYEQLLQRSLSVLNHLQRRGIQPRQEVILYIDNHVQFLYAFWSCVLGNFIPVPVTASTTPEHISKLNKIAGVLGNAFLITDMDLKSLDVHGLWSSEHSADRTMFIDSNDWNGDEGVVHTAEEDEIAFIQFSSGSTGEPKGVMLTHRNLLTNIRAIMKGMHIQVGETCLNWMPFTHDMGLIGGHLTPLTAQVDQYQMPTSLFVRRPTLWLKKASEYRIEYLSSPNFGYKYVLDMCKDSDLAALDLSSVRLIFNGAEPISASLCHRFLEKLIPQGLRADVFFPVYGMAEASLAITFPKIGDGLQSVCLARNQLNKGKRVRFVTEEDSKGVIFVDEGFPVDNCRIRICGDDDQLLPERTIGHIHIQGDNVTKGYYNNPEATERVLTTDGWLRTGDLGFIHNGRLVVTGREKDILFVNGQNFYPYDIENVAETIEGIQLGRVVACGAYNTERAQDDLIIFLYAKPNMETFIPLSREVKRTIKDKMGLDVQEVIPIRRIPKTTSGKVQRYKLAANYVDGVYSEIINEIRKYTELSAEEASIDREPITETERKLLALVKAATGKKEISLMHSLREIGLNSLKAIYINAQIMEHFELEIPLGKLFELETVANVAKYIDTADTTYTDSIGPIARIEGLGPFPSLLSQRRLYVLEQLDGVGTSNHITIALKVKGQLDPQKCRLAVNSLLMKHEALRTTFQIVDQELMQFIHVPTPIEIEEIQMKGTLSESVGEWITPYHLQTYPLWRVGVTAGQKKEEHTLVFDFHHMIMDGSSVMQLLEDFFAALSGHVLKQPKVQFKDVCLWRKQQEASEAWSAHEAYWMSRFSDEIPILELPIDGQRPTVQSFHGDSIHFTVNSELTAELKHLAQATGTTLYMVLLTTYYVWLSKHTGQRDIVIGSPFANRTHPDIQQTVGMLINTLPLRINGQARNTFEELLAIVKEDVYQALEHQSYWCEQLVEKLKIHPELNRNALYDTVFIMQNMAAPMIGEEWHIELEELERKTSRLDVTLEVVEREGTLSLIWEYNTDLFDRASMGRMAVRYCNILQTLVRERSVQLDKLSIMNEQEQEWIAKFQNSGMIEPGLEQIKPFLTLFSEQARSQPDKMALQYAGEKVTYGELHRLTDQVAAALQDKGIGREVVVGIWMESGIQQVIAILGIWKAGGAYLPIDPNYPDERILYMLNDCKPALLLTDRNWSGQLSYEGEVLELQTCTVYEGLVSSLDHHEQNHLAVILYTSGTTGNPKGVMIEHGNLTAYIDAFKREFAVTSNDVVLQQASFAFDNFIEEVFPALAYGAKLVMMKKEDVLDMRILSSRLIESQMTIISCSSLLVNEINKIKLPSSLRIVISGGDVLKWEYMSNLQEQCAVYNSYGPTEATVCASYYRCYVPDEQVPIGKPISHYRIYVMDASLQPVPIGVAGELCIAGAGVARGYWGNPELTTERFQKDWFVEGERIYRTGDLVKWLPDGNLAFMGRTDQQVKIRGYRIELSEVEKAIEQLEMVSGVRVIATREGASSLYLCAYILSARPWTAAELRRELAEKVPDYMIPSYFIEIERFPMTVHGKLDRKQLPNPTLSPTSSEEMVKPEGDIERRLANIWADVLGIQLSQVSVHDDFFLSGGHSLKATILASRIDKEIEAAVTIRHIFAEPTIRQLANRIQLSRPSKLPLLVKRDRTSTVCLASAAQTRMFMLHQIDPNSTSYNISKALLIEGNLEQQKVQAAVNQLIHRHELLRTSFHFTNGEVWQHIHEGVMIAVDWMTADNDHIPSMLTSYIRPFALERPGLLRVAVYQLDTERSVLVVDMHHIVSDATTVGILLNEFKELYEGNILKTNELQYRDYAAWHHELLSSEFMSEQEAYWLEQFKILPDVLQLPTDYARPRMQSFQGATLSFTIDESVQKRLYELTNQTDTTLYMLLLSAYATLLSIYTGQSDIVIGSPVAGRSHADMEAIVGMFVNTLAIRCHPEREDSFLLLLQNVKKTVLDAIEAQQYPFERLVERVQVVRDSGRNPLFDTVFVMQNAELPTMSTKDWRASLYPIQHTNSMFDLTLECMDLHGEMQFSLEYSTDLFTSETAQRMMRHYVQVLHILVEQPHLKLAEIELLNEDEKQQVLYQFNDTVDAENLTVTLPQLFIAQAQRTPNAIAIRFEDIVLTYHELNHLTNEVAHQLREMGIRQESKVAILIDRGPEQVIALLGVLKSGGAYVPIDTAYPQERIAFMLNDSQASVLLTDNRKEIATPTNIVVADMNALLNEARCNHLLPASTTEATWPVTSTSNPSFELINTPSNLAYMIYTSGSTGQPKGVMVEHCNLSAYIHAFQRQFQLASSDVVLQQASVSFDTYVEEVFPALTCGASILLTRSEDLHQIPQLLSKLEQEQVTVISASPLLLNEINKYPVPSKLRLAISGGDVLRWSYISKLSEHCDVFNTYGPTEATVCASYHHVERGTSYESIPIGKPIANVHIYILDNEDRPVPIGIAGQLCIGGAGVTRGYWGNPELTAEKYADNPYKEGDKLYRTGDLAKWLPNGDIQYLGRIDQQVNIRGYRIELEEVENVLLKYEVIAEAAVVCHKETEDTSYLCAYFVPKGTWSIAELRRFLAIHLPDYMIPSYFIELKRLPMTTNGKLDSRALPNPKDTFVSGKEVQPARNLLDQQLMNIWKEVLGLSHISITDDFFEIGGHSLKALELVNQMEQQLNITVPVSYLFRFSRLCDISDEMSNLNWSEKESLGAFAYSSSINPIELQSSYDMSAAQQRLYVIEQLETDSTAYNMPGAFYIEGPLSLTRMMQIWSELVDRHESLRTSFDLVDGEPKMLVHESVNFSIEYIDAEVEGRQDYQLEGDGWSVEQLQRYVRPFDLSKAPLLRVKLIRLAEEEHLFFIDMHHIISDAVSIEVLFHELDQLYHGSTLPPLTIQFKDFAAWQRQAAQEGQFERQRDYWLEQLRGELPTLEFPTDYVKGAGEQLSEGHSLTFELGSVAYERLKKVAAKLGVTPYMYLLSAYCILLSKYSSQEDIIVGVPVVGRSRSELQSVVGMFVNTLALRIFPHSDKSFTTYIREVKDAVTGAFQHQDLPLEWVIDEWNAQREQRDVNYRALFTTMFSHREEESQVHFGSMPVQVMPLQNQKSKFDFAMEAVQHEDRITFELNYAVSLFREETMQRFGHHLLQVLDVIIDKPDIILADIALLSVEQSLQQLAQYNPSETSLELEPVHYWVEQQVAINPERIAVECGDEAISFAELNGRANAMAHWLRNQGIGPGSYVPVWMDRCIELVVSIFAVMKTGAAFVPMDAGWPTGRVASILEDTGAAFILTNDSLKYSEVLLQFPKVSAIAVHLEEWPLASNLGRIAGLDDTIYVIYTSGSTGKPKGVVVPHLGIANRFAWMNDYFGDTAARAVLQMTAHVFDSSVWQFFWPLTRGGKTVLPDSDKLLSADYISATIEKHQITLTDFVPSVFNVIVEQLLAGSRELTARLRTLTSVIVGGEEVAASTVYKFQSLLPDVQLTNLYGPTEASIGCIYHQVRGNEGHRIPIGKPIYNTQILLLDKHLQVAPPGVTAEIYIAGLCLGTGYLHDPVKTDAVFLPHPYPESGWNRMYRTGDLARYRKNGEIEYLGRADFQVKIRGLRVELGEIESQILQTNLVKEAIVTAADIEGQPMLCAYVVSDEQPIDTMMLKQKLSAILPSYMVPPLFVQLTEMPLAPSGKVDRKALPAPDLIQYGERVQPNTLTEQKLHKMWRSVLDFNDIGITDDFFMLGGHSLKLFALASRIRQQFGIDIALRDLFSLTTIQEQARWIDEQRIPFLEVPQLANELSLHEVAATVDAVGELECGLYIKAPASAAQQAMYIVHHLEGVGTSYNMPQVFEWSEQVDEAHFHYIVQQLVERHEALRTRFQMIDGELLQIISRSWTAETVMLEDMGDGLDGVMERFVQPFDLTMLPLFRIGLYRSEERNFVFIDMHHIISDGQSMAVLIEDFIRIYRGESLPALPVKYRHYAEWQHRMKETAKWIEDESFWLQQFDSLPDLLQLPTDYKRPSVPSFEGDAVQLMLSVPLSNQIKELSQRTDSTLYMLMLACYTILLSKYSGQEDIVVGTPVSGRAHIELESIVGMFVNTLPVRNKVTPELSFSAYVNQVKDNVLNCLEHQYYPFDNLVRRLNVERNGSSSVLFNTMLAVDTAEKTELKDLMWTTELHNWKDKTVKFDLILTARDNGDQILLDLQYANRLFSKETAYTIMDHIQLIWQQVVQDSKKPISELSLLPEEASDGQSVETNMSSQIVEAAADFDFE
ncbi:non-ribosomal peptide synthetase [Paenibacillus arenosi]|uniref:Amino acid adenylation domain-containing protein n=1 Tax=Paenibacillus arenosi TaxID=2774142 RepID=A0ABR9B396_9BACL|nr:non-ribosomal peptide synthetase [Paenibacillus arenosi]MBD8499641.1 amino acid adenylation domain-containing protein [Paenibacillus arenosi]